MPAESPIRLAKTLLSLWVAAFGATAAHAYSPTGMRWYSNTVTMQLQLGMGAGTLTDGSASWNAVAESALLTWNQNIGSTQFRVVRDSTAPIARGNNTNNVLFSGDVYGDAWGAGVLAVTLTYGTNSGQTTETDVLFNTGISWDSYRGAQRYNSSGAVYDMRRVALHEFGHVLGLDHPDQNGQSVSALMNSHISNLDSLTSDDIAGAQSLYGAGSGGTTATPPVITTQPTSLSVAAGTTVSFSVAATGSAPLSFQWQKNGAGLPGATSATLSLTNVTASSAGSYAVIVANAAGSVMSSAASLTVSTPTSGGTTVTPSFTSQPVSRSVTAGSSVSFSVSASGTPAPTYQWYKDSSAISGATSSTFTLASTRSTDAGSYFVRATNSAGAATSNPATLTVNPLATMPTVTIPPAPATVSSGDSIVLRVTATGTPSPTYQWKKDGVDISGATQSQLIIVTATSADSGAYSVTIRNSAGSITTTPVNVTVLRSDLVNLSTRGYVPAGGNALTAGFVLRGSGTKSLVSRAVGPALRNYGVTDFLADPHLVVVAQTDVAHPLATNSGWSQSPQLATTFGSIGAFPLSAGSADAATQLPLPAAAYSARVTSDTFTGGVALAEIYDAEPGNPRSRLVNLSSLGYAGSGEKALVAGFTVQGNKSKRLLVRAIGPTLSQFNVATPLANPKLEVYPLGTNSRITSNDDWAGTTELKSAFSAVGAFQLPDFSRDAAAILTIEPGSYTIVVTSADTSAGYALVEIYDLDP